MDKLKLQIVEDELLVAQDIAERLKQDGYSVVGICDNMEDAIDVFKKQSPDLVLLDISIKGKRSGIDIAYAINDLKPTPFIYITAHADAVTVNAAKETFPAAYVIKPFTTSSLLISIELALHNFASKHDETSIEEKSSERNIFLRQNYIFVKDGHSFVKLFLNDILYVSAEDNYICIVTSVKSILIRNTLTKALSILKNGGFVRVHRSYCVNVNHIDAFTEHDVTIGDVVVPIGRVYKEDIMKQFRFT